MPDTLPDMGIEAMLRHMAYDKVRRPATWR